MAFSLEYIYRIVDRFSGPLNRFRRAMQSTSARITRMGNKLDAIGSKMANLGGALGGATVIAAFAMTAKAASRMEDSMANVSKVTSMGGKNLDKFEDKLAKMAMQTGKSAVGLAAIATAGGKLGVSDKDLMKFVTTVSKAGAAFDMTDEEAGRAIGSIRAKLSLSTDSVNVLLQRVNYLADNTSADGKNMINILERTAGTFKMLKMQPAAAAGWAAFADQVETSSELAASGLNMMFTRMERMPGMSKKMLKDPTKAVTDLMTQINKLPEAQRGARITKMFGDEAGRFVKKLAGGMDTFNDAMSIAGSNKALGSLDREFQNIMNRSSTLGKRLLIIFTRIKIAVGKVFLKVFRKAFPYIERIGKGILAFVKAHPGLVKLAGAFGVILLAIIGIAVPVGMLFGILAAGAPILAAVVAGVGALAAPIGALTALGVAAGIMLVGMWKNSFDLRQSFSNLADAFSPVTNGLKMIGGYIKSYIGDSFRATGVQLGSWGDAIALVVNMVAGLFKGLFDIIESVSKAIAALVHGDLGVAITTIKDMDISKMATKAGGKMMEWGKDAMTFMGIGNGAAESKASQTPVPVNVGGRIDVTASGGAQVNQSQINLNAGQNMAIAQ